MPYGIRRNEEACSASEPWELYREAEGDRPERHIACHPSQESADRQMRAIGIATHESGNDMVSFAAMLSFDDPDAYASFRVNESKRTISGMVVPWGKVAVSRGSRWRFSENSLRWGDASRIKLNLGHDRAQTVGYAAAMRNTSQGLDVTFKIASVPEGDRALALAAGKAWDGLSIEIDFDDEFGDDWQADPTDQSTRLVSQAKLVGVALTPMPAFDDARVAAVAASKPEQEEQHGHGGSAADHQLRQGPAPAAPAGRTIRLTGARLRRVH